VVARLVQLAQLGNDAFQHVGAPRLLRRIRPGIRLREPVAVALPVSAEHGGRVEQAAGLSRRPGWPPCPALKPYLIGSA